jgi:hypothetical protein
MQYSRIVNRHLASDEPPRKSSPSLPQAQALVRGSRF